MEAADWYKMVVDNVAKYGFHVWNIMGDQDSPRYSYSVGLYKTYQHPEIIIIGLEHELAHSLINLIAEDISKGEKYEAFSWSSALLSGFECYFINVDKERYEEYVAGARWFYKGLDFPLLQCIYPTVKGIYPWEDAWPEDDKNLQPILGDLNIA